MRALVLLILSAAALFAQADTWNLLKGIYPGQPTHVHLTTGKMLDGGFISTSESHIVIRLRHGDETIAKDQVRKVSVRKLSKRGRNALRGAAVGAGLVVALAAAARFNDPPIVAGAAAAYGIIGAGIGALFPGYDTLYRLPKK